MNIYLSLIIKNSTETLILNKILNSYFISITKMNSTRIKLLLISSFVLIVLLSEQVRCLPWIESESEESNGYDEEVDSNQPYILANKRAVPCCKRFSPKCCLYGFECCNSMNHCFSSMSRNCGKSDFKVRNKHFNHLGRTCGSMGYRCWAWKDFFYIHAYIYLCSL